MGLATPTAIMVGHRARRRAGHPRAGRRGARDAPGASTRSCSTRRARSRSGRPERRGRRRRCRRRRARAARPRGRGRDAAASIRSARRSSRRGARGRARLPRGDGFEAIPGTASRHGRRAAGRGRQPGGCWRERGVDARGARGAARAALADGGTHAVFVAVDGGARASLAVADPVRPRRREAVRELTRHGPRRVAGHRRRAATAEAVARPVGIGDRVVARGAPRGQGREIAAAAGRGPRVAMVGDGINDAPALARGRRGRRHRHRHGRGDRGADVTLIARRPAAGRAAIALSRATIRGRSDRTCSGRSPTTWS